MPRFIDRRPGTALFLMMFLCGAYMLWYGRGQHLFGFPQPGTDQRSILICALDLARGRLPEGQYRYSYAYTVFLGLAALCSGGTLWLMRLLQLALASLIPPLVFRTSRLCRSGKSEAFLAGLCCCLYAPLVLISLDFLRAAPLALAFVALVYFLLAAEARRRSGRSGVRRLCVAAGVCGALCALGRENFLAVVFLPTLFLWPRDRRDSAAYLGALALPLAAVLLFNAVFYDSFQLVPGNAGNILGFYGGTGAGRMGALSSIVSAVPGHLRDFCSSYELHNSLSVYAHRELIRFMEILFVPFDLLLALGVGGALLARRDRGARWCALLAAAYIASMLFFTVFYRFRIPVVPLLAVLAASAFRRMRIWWKTRRFSRLAGFAAASALFCAATWVAPDSRRLESERAAVARVLIFNRRLDEAERHLDKMARDGQDPSPELRLLARAFAEDGDIDGASRAISRLQALSKRRSGGILKQ